MHIRKNTRRLFGLVLTLALFLSVLPLGAAAAGTTGWQQNANGEWYYLKNGEEAHGWLQYNGAWYFLDGTMVHDSFLRIDSVQYYFRPDGRMATGWQTVSIQNPDGWSNYHNWQPHTYWTYFYSSGKQISDGWQKIGGSWYYFYYGEMMTGLYNTDPYFPQTGSANGSWYYLGESGAMQTGWQKLDVIYRGSGAFETVSPYWTYFYSSGEQVGPGWKTIGGTLYLFDEYGRLTEDVRGWKQENGSWYYYDGGERITGWFNSDPDFLATGSANGIWYYFNEDGRMHTGWKHFQGSYPNDAGVDLSYDYWAYFLSSGAQAENCWQKIGGAWYYFDADGVMLADGLYEINGSYYYFSAGGAMQTGWRKIPFVTEDGSTEYGWAYFTSSGAMKMSGWQWDGSGWYYFRDGGYYAGGLYEIGSDYYYFNDSGSMYQGWKYIEGAWRYFGSSGMVINGQVTDGGKSYYIRDGAMIRNSWAGSRYYGSDGVMLRNTSRTIGGTYYTFGSDGASSPMHFENPYL